MSSAEDSKKRNDIREIQHSLYILSLHDGTIPKLTADGVFGERTAEAVRAFQSTHNLNATGEVNHETWKLLMRSVQEYCEEPSMPRCFPKGKKVHLQFGDTGIAVSMLQVMLQDISRCCEDFPDVEITGTYDLQTIRAVQLFRKMASLPPGNDTDLPTWQSARLAAAGVPPVAS